jgi:hypothetical protein
MIVVVVEMWTGLAAAEFHMKIVVVVEMLIEQQQADYHMKIGMIELGPLLIEAEFHKTMTVLVMIVLVLLIGQLVDFHTIVVVVFGQFVVVLLFDCHTMIVQIGWLVDCHMMIAVVVVEMWTGLAVEFHTK